MLRYPFVPYPVELAALETRQGLSRAQLEILALRRFADPVTGQWETTTQEVANRVVRGRSTVQKALRALEESGYLHLRRVRGHTVRLILCFGGFPRPSYRAAGKPPLYWDTDFTPTTGRLGLPYLQELPLCWQTSGPCDPSVMPLLLKMMHSHILYTLGTYELHLRANVLMPVSTDRLQVRYAYNMDEDTDRHLELGANSGAAGRCWRTGEAVVCDLEDARSTFRTKWRMHEHQQRRVRPSLKSLLCVPVFSPPACVRERRDGLLCVLSFDSDHDLLGAFRRALIQRAGRECSLLVGEYLSTSRREAYRAA